MGIESRKAKSMQMFFGKLAPRALSAFICFDESISARNWPFWRKFNDALRVFMPRCLDVDWKMKKIEGVDCLVLTPHRIRNQNIIYYIHGGGFVNGSARSTGSYGTMLAHYSGCRVISCDYSLAPEHPYPAGLNDCVAVYKGIQKEYGGRIALVGESAGGNLVLSTAFKVMDDGLEKPASVSAHSPMIDLSMTIKREDHIIKDFTVKQGCLPALKKIYGDGKSGDVYCSPYFGNYKDFPPLFISCDENEMLETDSQKLYEKAVKAGVETYMIKISGAFHAFAVMGSLSPESKYVLRKNVSFIKESFKR